jgi:hypothetical protein
MSEKPNSITVYRTQTNKPLPGWEFHPASPKRDWMDEYNHIYRCLPMTIANQNGWVVPCPCDIQAVWFGGQDRRAMHFWVDPEYNQFSTEHHWVKCHFVGGVITFEFDFMIRTNPGTNLLVRGAPNFFIEGAVPLEGVVETDWLDYSFTMNWRLTTPDKVVRFKKGDPICFLQPIPHNYAETFSFDIDFLENNRELNEKFHAYNNSRGEFMKRRQEGKEKNVWQRHYFNGKNVKGNAPIGEDRHAIKLNLSDVKSQNIVKKINTDIKPTMTIIK